MDASNELRRVIESGGDDSRSALELPTTSIQQPFHNQNNNNKRKNNSTIVNDTSKINSNINKKKTTKEFLKLRNKLRKISKQASSLSSIKMPKAYPKQQFAFDEMDHFNKHYDEAKHKNNTTTGHDHGCNENNNNTSSPAATPTKTLSQDQEDKKANPNKCKHRIFSQELASTGKRTFLSCCIDTFFNAYLNIPPRQRHYYEIIRQNSPCRLYFDCEFYKEFNPTVDGNGMINLFIRYVATSLQSYFGIMVSLENFLDLDSSTDKKCSHHIVVHLPENQLFLNNIHVGNFVSTIANNCKPLSRLHLSHHQDNIYGSELWVRGKKGELCFFSDLAVYTKNRAFRLVYSSKFSKDTILLPSKQNKFPVDMMSKSGERQLFFDSLISYTIDEAPSSLAHLEFHSKKSNDNGHSRNNFRNSIRNDAYKKENIVGTMPNEISEIVDYLIHVEYILIATDSIRVLSVPSSGQHPNANVDVHCVSKNKNQLLNDDQEYSYILATRTKKCRIAKRTHKSNHIWIKINIHSKTVFQHCHDEDCRHSFYKLNVPEELFIVKGQKSESLT